MSNKPEKMNVVVELENGNKILFSGFGFVDLDPSSIRPFDPELVTRFDKEGPYAIPWPLTARITIQTERITETIKRVQELFGVV